MLNGHLTPKPIGDSAMQSLSFTSLADLFPDEPWRTVFLCIVLISCIYKIDGLRNDIYRVSNLIFKGVSWGIRAAINDFKQVTDHIYPSKIIVPKYNTDRFSAWIFIGLFSLFASYFILLGTVTTLLAVLKGYNQDNLLLVNAGLVFLILLSLAGYYYRGCAHKVAKENGINITFSR